MCKYNNIHSKLSGYCPDDFWLALPFNSVQLFRGKTTVKQSDWKKIISGILYLKGIGTTDIANGFNISKYTVHYYLNKLDSLLEVDDQKLSYPLGRLETARKIRVFS